MGQYRQTTYRHLSNAIDEAGGAACQDVPEVFFPEDYPDRGTREYAIRLAKTLCEECPIREICFAYAIENREPYGVWAGTLPHER
jgi:WhiB family transcriptional regulator, redox-sensing transcriptional regulator